MTDALRLPANPAAERAVLGAILASGDMAIARSSALIGPDDFYDATNRAVYKAAVRLASSGVTPDLVTLSDELVGKVSVGDLAALGAELPDTANVEHWARIVRDTSRRRALQHIGLDMMAQTSNDCDHTDDILEDSSRRIAELGSAASDAAVEAYDAAADSLTAARAEARGESRDPGVLLGFGALDAALGGICKGDLVTVGAGRGVGKSAFALQVASDVALRQGRSVVYVSLEMSKKQLGDRLLAQESGIPVGRIRHGKLDGSRWFDFGGDWSRVEKARDALKGARFSIVYNGDLGVAGIQTLCRARQLRRGLDLVVIDYLQLVEPEGRSRSTVEEITRLTRHLKRMAMRLQVPVIMLSQINRDPDKRANQRRRPGGNDPSEPTLSDLSWSGSIERDSDDVILLHRKIEGTEVEVATAIAILAKHRQGPTCRQTLRFEPQAVRFKEVV